ncbi:hypothetical protein M378DRAFT_158455 [Amanita muscaria Koide BX008]|uniref:Secreted protein n=1 Tax=Amanita muscaria (strain Koide BX008) TaxID=946122 RepID=A0A0C2TN70_AMAMK|nr:hypothetical protein M378DRAFT_158455 [Amanita muscaria Koide BX008]
MLFAFGVLCFFTALFFILCCSGKHSTAQANHIQQDTESCPSMDQRNGGIPASMYHDHKLGHELPQNSSRGHHRLPPLCSRAASQETVESITPTASQSVIYGNEEQDCKVHVTVTPPTPAKSG